MNTTKISAILGVALATTAYTSTALAQTVQILPKNGGNVQNIGSLPTPTPKPIQQTPQFKPVQAQTPTAEQPAPTAEQAPTQTPNSTTGQTDILADSSDPETLAKLRDDAEEMILEAEFTLRQVARHKEYKAEFTENMQKAKAVIIFPKVLKGGLGFGAEGGNGVILAKAPNGQWSYPSFYTMVGGSAGLQIGAQASEMVVLIMTDKALVATLKNRIRLGGELNAAVGTEGAGYEKNATTGTNFKTPDTHTYAINQGLFIGVAGEVSYMTERTAMNQAFYNTKPEQATTKTIIIQGQHANERANPLRKKLYSLSQGQ